MEPGDEPAHLDLHRGDSVVLTAVGEDRDGGVKDLALQGNVQVTCRDPATGAARVRTTGFLRRHVPGAAVGSDARPPHTATRRPWQIAAPAVRAIKRNAAG